MKYKKRKKDFHNKASYLAFINNPFGKTQTSRYFSKYFEVEYCERKEARYNNRQIVEANSEYGVILNKVLIDSNKTKRMYQKKAKKSNRMCAKKWLKNGDFDGSSPEVKYYRIVRYLD